MKKSAIAFVISIFISSNSPAMPIDSIGGNDGSTQTIHHCGYLAPSAKLYTNSPVLVRIIERKLATLGYLSAASDGRYGKADRMAVKRFQDDYGLRADGIVGPLTAQRLAFIGHPSAHVRGCQRVAGI